MSGFKLVPYGMNFGRTAWQDIQYYRAQRAAIVSDAQSLMDTASSAIETALQNQVSGAASSLTERLCFSLSRASSARRVGSARAAKVRSRAAGE